MIARKRTRSRTVSQLVRLTADERARADRIVKLYGGTLSDVLRAGIGALEREHEHTVEAPDAATDAGPRVHVLHQGRALCGLEGLPMSWPLGHRWVRLAERAGATCPACVMVAGSLGDAHAELHALHEAMRKL